MHPHGAVLTLDDEANSQVYGETTGREVLMKPGSSTPSSVSPFVAAVKRLTPAAAR